MGRKSLLCACFFVAPILLAAAGTGTNTDAADAKEGQKIFANHCAICHHAHSTETKVGPGLKGLFKKAKLKTGAAVTESSVRQLIENGHGGMPAWKSVLSKDQIDDLVAYLKTL